MSKKDEVEILKASALKDMRRKFDLWMRETEYEAVSDFLRADWKWITPTTMTAVLRTGAHAIAMEQEDKTWSVVYRPVEEPKPDQDSGYIDPDGVPWKENDPDAHYKALGEMQDRPEASDRPAEQDPPPQPQTMHDIAFNLAKKLAQGPEQGPQP